MSTTATRKGVFTLKITVDQHHRLRTASVPPALAAAGVQRLTVLAAIRFAVISYLGQTESQPSAPLKSAARAAGEWIQVNLPPALATQLQDRADAEGRSKASIVRAALDLSWPPALVPAAEAE